MSWALLEPMLESASPEARAAARNAVEGSSVIARRRSVRLLAQALGGATSGLALSLARLTDPAMRRIACELASRARHPGAALRRAIEPLLSDRKIPLSSRLAATRALARSADEDAAAGLIRAFASGLGKSRAVDRFQELAPRLGMPQAVEKVRAELVESQKLRCPRCGVMRARDRMRRHLWNSHQLLLDGQRARTPWQALDDRWNEPDLGNGLAQFHRHLLSNNFTDDEALLHLRGLAAERHESLCPRCFENVPLPEPPPLVPVEASAGRLSVGGFSVTLRDHRPRLTIESPGKTRYIGREPGRGWSARAIGMIAAWSAVFAVVAASLMPPPWHALTAGCLLGEVVILLTLAKRSADMAGDPTDRAVDFFWERLAPEMPPELVARLALASLGHGDARNRGQELARATATASAAVTAGTAPPTVLAPLWWLHADDAHRNGEDPLSWLAERLGECFQGKLPLVCAAEILDLAGNDLRSRSGRARLRALACEQAFQAGLGVWDLSELGRAIPAIADSLATEDTDGLARLRLLWDERLNRPWKTCGPASTVFEIARYPGLGSHALAVAPDLLLYQPMVPVGPEDDPSPVILCGRGLIYRELLWREAPTTMRVRQREAWRGGGFELHLGPHRLRFANDPTEMGKRLRQWAAFGRNEFLPRVESVLRYRATDRLAELLSPRRVPCSACGTVTLPILGRVALECGKKEKEFS